MAWIESHDDIWTHSKIRNLCRSLAISKPLAVGHLTSLWHFVLQNAWRDADLSAWGDDGIEEAARWEGDPGLFVEAAREAGFLNGSIVHGWMERAGRLVYDRLRKENERFIAVKRRTSGGLSKATVPNPTVQHPLTEQKPLTAVVIRGNGAANPTRHRTRV